MLNLRAVLTLNNRAFLFRRFRLVFEHREEPRRATRISVPLNLIYALPVSVVGSVKVMLSVLSAAPAVDGTHTHSALFIHFFSGVLIQQHIRRKTTSRGTAVSVHAY